MQVLQDLLAAGSHSPKRVVLVPHEDWNALLESIPAPSSPATARLLADLRKGASATGGAAEVGIQANHLKAMLDLAPPSPAE